METHITAMSTSMVAVVDRSREANMPDGAVTAYSCLRGESDEPMWVSRTVRVPERHFAFEADGQEPVLRRDGGPDAA
ncbi:MAG: hypothetical protein ACJ77D_07705 [Chloroflexota bacterium]